MNRKDYVDLVVKTFNLIMAEMNKAEKSKHPKDLYPNLIIMYEFFRLLRGEAFFDLRPMPLPTSVQKLFYEYEDKLNKKLQSIRKKV